VAVWIALVAAALAVLLLYAWWTARRLDRLHVRLDAAAAAFDEQLVRRAEAARRCVEAGADGCDETLLATAAAALARRGRMGPDREVAENALGSAVVEAVQRHPAATGAMTELFDQSTRVAVARRFYNDAVRDVLVVRDRRVVRWLHLAGRAPLPAYVELDDTVLSLTPPPNPIGLSRSET
jgi:hypothetical protein